MPVIRDSQGECPREMPREILKRIVILYCSYPPVNHKDMTNLKLGGRSIEAECCTTRIAACGISRLKRNWSVRFSLVPLAGAYLVPRGDVMLSVR